MRKLTRMRKLKRSLRLMLIAGSLTAPVVITGCAVHAGYGYRVCDPYYHDYHAWGDDERGYYRQWAIENRRDEHRDFRNLNHHEQEEYWHWRHDHH